MKKHSTMLSSLMVVLVLILTGAEGFRPTANRLLCRRLVKAVGTGIGTKKKASIPKLTTNWPCPSGKRSMKIRAWNSLTARLWVGRMKKLTTQRRRLLKGFQPACLRKMRMQISFFGPCSPLGGNAKRSTITPVPIAGRLGTAAG